VFTFTRLKVGRVGMFSIADAKDVALYVAVVLGLTYVLIVAVALFHPDPQRRFDARALLKRHRFTRKR
jgi:hypothetical protein